MKSKLKIDKKAKRNAKPNRNEHNLYKINNYVDAVIWGKHMN